MPTKKDLRENLSLPTFENSSETELFQNNVLRPVLKLQKIGRASCRERV